MILLWWLLVVVFFQVTFSRHADYKRHYDSAVASISNEDWAMTIAHLKKALNVEPENVDALQLLGEYVTGDSSFINCSRG